MKELIGATVVVDTSTSYIYIGTLAEVNADCVVLTQVDVHDRKDVEISKERYILDSRRHGVKANRDRTYILREHVVSVSKLDDVIKF
ncbi:MAG: hypothetical protein ABIF71_11710 [Planctomycetota bacterium]